MGRVWTALFIIAAIQTGGCHALMKRMKVMYYFNVELIQEKSNQQALRRVKRFVTSALTKELNQTSAAQFHKIKSTLLGNCKGSKDGTCLRYMGIISVNVDEAYYEGNINQVILSKAEKYIKDFNEQNADIFVSFDGPFLYSTDTIIRLWNVKRLMNEKEIKIFEDAVFETLTSQKRYDESSQDRDTNITKVSVDKQVLITSDRRRLQGVKSNDVYVSVVGSCRSCSKEKFDMFTNDAIGDSYSDIEKKLQEKESSSSSIDSEDNYFEDAFVIPLGTNESDTSYTDENVSMARESGKTFPMYIIFGLLSGVGILFIGIGYTARKYYKSNIKKVPELEED